MQDYKDYEGRCKYCGHTEIILSESQEQADEYVSRKCLCEGREMVLDEQIEKASITVYGFQIDVCPDHHRWLHGVKERNRLRAETEIKYIAVEAWRQIVGKNYCEEINP